MPSFTFCAGSVAIWQAKAMYVYSLVGTSCLCPLAQAVPSAWSSLPPTPLSGEIRLISQDSAPPPWGL